MQFRDPVVERVCRRFQDRSDVGYVKYGITLEDDRGEMIAWLNHFQEEHMDAVLYFQKAKGQYEAQSSEE